MPDLPRENGRAWVAECQWKGKRPFWFGTVFARLGATHQEIEAAVMVALKEIVPDDIRRPDVIRLAPGMLVFLPEDDNA